MSKPTGVFPRIELEEKAEAETAAGAGTVAPVVDPETEAKLRAAIGAAGDAVRAAKEGGGTKDVLEPLVGELLALKSEFKQTMGFDFDPPKEKKKKKAKKVAS